MIALSKAEFSEDLQQILDLSFDQITITDGNGIFELVSKSAEEIFGIKESEIIGASAFDMEKIGVFDISISAEVIRQQKQMTIIQKTRSGRVLRVKGQPIFDKKGKIRRIINVSKDITETEALEKEISLLKKDLDWHKNQYKKFIYAKKNYDYKSKYMQQILNTILMVADKNVTILLQGETGTGKGYTAKQIHNLSNRKNEPFITVNCGAIPKELLESELFGYEKGAFTGANDKGKIGLLEAAGKGTLFLDEIGNMPLDLQIKILHVLDDFKFYHIGGVKEIDLNARVIAATNFNLREEVDKGNFREDLYYRLNVIPINIPPLRKRREDIIVLLNQFLEEYNKKYSYDKNFSARAFKVLLSYDYPGNIRELENTVERLVLTVHNDVIEEEDVRSNLRINNTIDYKDKVKIEPLEEAVERLEKEMLMLAKEKYKTTRAMAEVLGVNQSTISRKLSKYNLKI